MSDLRIGLTVVLCFVSFLSGAYLNHYGERALIEECQAELPRNQECVLIAVPKDSEGQQ